ncbi:YEATS-associated helix-containing protein [Flavobacterium anhuiense]|uniref:YEATS-associated helix-containing protein n=1 Tax=Flavobacterium anhuiense TaxID=459526 RepID=UPI003D987318
MSAHFYILIAIIILVGSLAGLTNYLSYYYKDLIKKDYEYIRYILSGIGASILVPLLLNMLSSNLIKEVNDYDIINYFVFAGFCYVAGYFSDRFISSIGEKILKDLEQTKAKVEKTNEKVKETNEKLDIIVDAETESEDNVIEKQINLDDLKVTNSTEDDDIKVITNKIIKSLNGKFKFRTISGIAKEIKHQPSLIELILGELEKLGIVKKVTNKEEQILYALTKVGIKMDEQNDAKLGSLNKNNDSK